MEAIWQMDRMGLYMLRRDHPDWLSDIKSAKSIGSVLQERSLMDSKQSI